MRHARQHAETRTRERRHRLAHEAARLIAEAGIHDYQQAKRKAAARLGIVDDASLPGNREIQDALREYHRLFHGASHALELRQRREAALRAMEFLACFHPRLAGPVLEGLADSHSPVTLHLHVDDADAVQRFLADRAVPARLHSLRVQLDRRRNQEMPVWAVNAEGFAFELAVLPPAALRQAPLSDVDDKPMQRASAAQLRQLLASEEIADYESES